MRRGYSRRFRSGKNSYNVTHPTFKALAEVGKAEKSIFLCDYLPSQETQHEVHEDSIVDGEIRPAWINCATCGMSGKWQAIRFQSTASLVNRSLMLR